MTVFFRLLAEQEKEQALLTEATQYRHGEDSEKTFVTEPTGFFEIPGAPFSYWVTEPIRSAFSRLPSFADVGGAAKVGLQTSDDFRFVRTFVEPPIQSDNWLPYAKGGEYATYYSNIHLVVRAANNFSEIVEFTNARYPYLNGNARSLMHAEIENFLRSGITWTKSTTLPVSFRCFPTGSIYSVSGLGAEIEDSNADDLLAFVSIMNSSTFKYLISLSLGLAAEGRKHYETGIVNKNPVPKNSDDYGELASLARRAWKIGYQLDSINEFSLAFCLPLILRARVSTYDFKDVLREVGKIQGEVDALCYSLYAFDELAEKIISSDSREVTLFEEVSALVKDDELDYEKAFPSVLSWCVGVLFGRFDWRLATGERGVPPVPDPFARLPAKSPGMLPDGAAPFRQQHGILVDDPGHEHDLPHLIESVLERVEIQGSDNLRRWLQKDFFKEHLKRYSKSRRKAPIYWPLSTPSGNYTLWIYYPELDDQTLYTAVNDFIEPKLKLADDVLSTLRAKSGRTASEEREFEKQQDFQEELIELRDTILAIAPTYMPNHDDGVQITAAPLWPLFRHRPWQKVLKDTWEKLQAGEYDWAHLAYSYWPDRVREKCRTDKSLAIAHGLEELYEEPAA